MLNLQPYWDLIFSQRQWSWTLVGSAYLIAALFLRFLLFRGTLRETKELDKGLYSEVLRLYLKHSVTGWVFFALSFLLVICLWRGWRPAFFQKSEHLLALVLLSSLFLLSVIFHYQAFVKALLSVLRQRTGVEKEY